MRHLIAIEEALLACTDDGRDREYMVRQCLAQQGAAALEGLLFESLCNRLVVDPNGPLLSRGRRFPMGGRQERVAIVKWRDEYRSEPEFVLDIVEYCTHQNPNYACNGVLHALSKGTAFSTGMWNGAATDVYAVCLASHFHRWNPHHRHLFGKASYSALLHARDRLSEAFAELEAAMERHSDRYGTAGSGTLFRHDGYRGFGMEARFFVCADGR